MIDAQIKAQTLIAQCERTAQLPPSHPGRTADMILQHRLLRELLAEHSEFHEGFKQEHLRLVSLGYELLGTVTASTNGRADWTSELPPGKAPGFRRALNKFIAYLRGDGEQS